MFKKAVLVSAFILFSCVNAWSLSFDFDSTFELPESDYSYYVSYSGSYSGSGQWQDSDSWQCQTPPAPVPEPATMLLFGTGMIAVAGLGKLRKTK